MSQLSKKYCNPSDLEDCVFLTWDIQFNTISVYLKGVKNCAIRVDELKSNNCKILNQNNEEIEITLLNKQRREFLVESNGQKWYVAKKVKQPKVRVKRKKKTNVKPLSWLFLTAIILHIVDICSWANDGRELFLQRSIIGAIPIYWMEVFILLIILFGFTFYFLRKNMGIWFFVGFPLLFGFTSLEIHNYKYVTHFMDPETLYTTNIILRLLICIILLLNILRPYNNIRLKRNKMNQFDSKTIDS